MDTSAWNKIEMDNRTAFTLPYMKQKYCCKGESVHGQNQENDKVGHSNINSKEHGDLFSILVRRHITWLWCSLTCSKSHILLFFLNGSFLPITIRYISPTPSVLSYWPFIWGGSFNSCITKFKSKSWIIERTIFTHWFPNGLSIVYIVANTMTRYHLVTVLVLWMVLTWKTGNNKRLKRILWKLHLGNQFPPLGKGLRSKCDIP